LILGGGCFLKIIMKEPLVLKINLPLQYKRWFLWTICGSKRATIHIEINSLFNWAFKKPLVPMVTIHNQALGRGHCVLVSTIVIFLYCCINHVHNGFRWICIFDSWSLITFPLPLKLVTTMAYWNLNCH
jgi:hypothetical protein